jgi:hypothetical protein
MALQPPAQQPAATPGTCPPARLLQCRLDAHAAAIQVSSQPAPAQQQQLVGCGPAPAAWLSADVGLAVAPAAGVGAAAAGETHTCLLMCDMCDVRHSIDVDSVMLSALLVCV